MPFTLAHPVLVIPLRRQADLTALVIGSMVPDLTHFVGLEINRNITHHPFLWPLFCMPAGLLVYLLFTRLLREPLLSLAPRGLVERLVPRDRQARARGHWKGVLLGLAIGAGSHLAFDAITTINFRYRWAPPLLAPLIAPAGVPISAQDLLRHGGALVGMAVIAFWIWQWWRRAPRRALEASDLGPFDLSPVARAAIVMVAIVVVLTAALLATLAEDGISTRHLIGQTVRTAMPAFSAVLSLYALVWHGWRRLLR